MKSKLEICVSMLMIVGFGGLFFIGWWNYQPEEPFTRDPVVLAAWRKINPHVNVADQSCFKAVEKHCNRVREFFAERKKRGRVFAEEALSLRSKWRYVKSKLPFTDAAGHQDFLRECFEKTVFSSREMEDVIRSAVEGCLAEWQAIENKLLMDIRADLGDDALASLKDGGMFSSEAVLREAYARAMERTGKAFGVDMAIWTGREGVAMAGGNMAAPVIHALAVSLAGRLGVSGTVLSGGVASGAVTLGGGVIAGVIIDALLDHLLRLLGYDPEEKIEKLVAESLEYSADLVVLGKVSAKTAKNKKSGVAHSRGGSDGLFHHLTLLASQRAQVREKAVKTLLAEGGRQ